MAEELAQALAASLEGDEPDEDGFRPHQRGGAAASTDAAPPPGREGARTAGEGGWGRRGASVVDRKTKTRAS